MHCFCHMHSTFSRQEYNLGGEMRIQVLLHWVTPVTLAAVILVRENVVKQPLNLM